MAVSRDIFHWSDYVVVALFLVISLGIGIFQSCTGGKQRTHGEYFLGNRKLSPVPVGMSILMSFMSSVLILGATAEMYTRGTQWIMWGLGIALCSILTALMFVPLLHPLKLTSANEYLELRFKSKLVRLFGTVLLIISQLLFIGVITYAPAISMDAVTGIPYWVSILCCGVVATAYTTFGGIKAVIWTDVFQAAVMILGMIAIAIVGTVEVGGASDVWNINKQWDRIQFNNFDVDPRAVNTFWSCTLGGGMGFFGVYAVNQAGVQRYSSLPTIKQAQASLILNVPALLVLFCVACFTGTVVFAYFAQTGCDPLKDKQIFSPNQLLPLFMMKVLGYPCLPGLFVASLFAGSLSTMSSCLNGLAAATWEDMFKWKFNHLKEERKTLITKIMVIIYGAIGIGVGFAFKRLSGTIIQGAGSFFLTSMGPLLGLFLLGSIFPWANWKGAIIGAVTGLGVSMWISIGSYALGLPAQSLPTPHYNCTNFIPKNRPTIQIEGVGHLYTVSYQWIPAIATLITLVVGLLLSLVTGPTKPSDVDRKYLMPYFDLMCCCLPESWRKRCRCGKEEETKNDLSLKKTKETENGFVYPHVNEETRNVKL